MKVSKDLNNLKILITRPRHQATALCAAISAQGGMPLLFPTLEIADPIDKSSVQQVVKQFKDFDIAIFVSANAVFKALPFLPKNLSRLNIAAIGPATAKVLTENGWQVTIMPSTGFNSEALLNHPALQQLTNKKIVIFCGEGGRNLLEKELKSRGAQVTKAVVYRRVKPNINIDQVLAAWQKSGIDIIVSTSNESLENLITLLGSHKRQWLVQIPLLVVSERMYLTAQAVGFNEIVMAADATDKAIFAAIKKWYSK